MDAIRLTIRGKVQGVFFRDWAMRQARTLGLGGWVRNRRDGSVELYAIGPDEALARLAAACGEGPPRARVEAVEREEAEIEPLEGFTRRPTA